MDDESYVSNKKTREELDTLVEVEADNLPPKVMMQRLVQYDGQVYDSLPSFFA